MANLKTADKKTLKQIRDFEKSITGKTTNNKVPKELSKVTESKKAGFQKWIDEERTKIYGGNMSNLHDF